MAASTQHVLLSPAELAFLHTSLSLNPPIRPDGRSATQFRPLVAETGVLPGTNGSARVCFADGTEAIVGVKAEVERTRLSPFDSSIYGSKGKDSSREEEGEIDDEDDDDARKGDDDWVEITVEIPGLRDDDASTVFLAAMLAEALLADGTFVKRLWINRRFHWKLYLDIILISPPLSYPLPLLSLTSHLALLATRLPRLKSEGDEDPFFDDDWEAATYLYPKGGKSRAPRPPITLLVMAVGTNTIFDPSKEELAVADVALAVSVGERPRGKARATKDSATRDLRLLSVRTIDPPSRLTPPGVPNSANAANDPSAAYKLPEARATETGPVPGVWKAPRGGVKAAVLAAMTQSVLASGGIVDEVLDGLEGVELS